MTLLLCESTRVQVYTIGEVDGASQHSLNGVDALNQCIFLDGTGFWEILEFAKKLGK